MNTLTAMPFIVLLPPPLCEIDLRTLLQILFTPPALLLLQLGPGPSMLAGLGGELVVVYDAKC